MAADGYTEKIRFCWASRIFHFVIEFFPQKILDKVLSLEIQLIICIICLWHLKISAKSKKKKKRWSKDPKKQKMEQREFEMNYGQNCNN